MVDQNVADGFDLYTAEHIDLDCEKKYTLDVGDDAVTGVQNEIFFISHAAGFNVVANTNINTIAGSNWIEVVEGMKDVDVTGNYDVYTGGDYILNTEKHDVTVRGSSSWFKLAAEENLNITNVLSLTVGASEQMFIGGKLDIAVALAMDFKFGGFVGVTMGASLEAFNGLKVSGQAGMSIEVATVTAKTKAQALTAVAASDVKTAGVKLTTAITSLFV